jgi:transcription elongation factor GreA
LARRSAIAEGEEATVTRHGVETLDKVVVTAAGYAQLMTELETLRTEKRREMADWLREARADGDLADNSALFEILEEQAQLERRIAVLATQLATARVATPATSGVADIGSSVRVRDADTGDVAVYQLVGRMEADAGNGRISIEAPVGRALVERRAGECVNVETPRGTMTLEILDVGAAMAKAA